MNNRRPVTLRTNRYASTNRTNDHSGSDSGTTRGSVGDFVPVNLTLHLGTSNKTTVCGYSPFLAEGNHDIIAWKVEDLLIHATNGNVCTECLGQVKRTLQLMLDVCKAAF